MHETSIWVDHLYNNSNTRYTMMQKILKHVANPVMTLLSVTLTHISFDQPYEIRNGYRNMIIMLYNISVDKLTASQTFK